MSTHKIKIKESKFQIPGFGGINYDGLTLFGWQPGMWLEVVKENVDGVYVRFPKNEGSFFIWKHEIGEELFAPEV